MYFTDKLWLKEETKSIAANVIKTITHPGAKKCKEMNKELDLQTSSDQLEQSGSESVLHYTIVLWGSVH